MTGPSEKGPIEEAIGIAKARWERPFPSFEDNIDRMIQILKRKGKKDKEYPSFVSIDTSGDYPAKGISCHSNLEDYARAMVILKEKTNNPDRVVYFNLVKKGPPVNPGALLSKVVNLVLFVQGSEKWVELTLDTNRIKNTEKYEAEADPENKIKTGNMLTIKSKEAELKPKTRAFLDFFVQKALNQLEVYNLKPD